MIHVLDGVAHYILSVLFVHLVIPYFMTVKNKKNFAKILPVPSDNSLVYFYDLISR